MRLLHNVVHAVFGCRHQRLSRLFTIRQQSYMVCLECGRKVFYSMDEMRRLSRREVRHLQAAPAEGFCAVAAARPGAQAAASDPTLAA